MRLLNDIFERLPMVWLLLGLLFMSAGLYLGFDYRLSFVYLGIGAICSLYGVILFLFLLRERPKRSRQRSLSPHFISIGPEVAMPSPADADRRGARRPGHG